MTLAGYGWHGSQVQAHNTLQLVGIAEPKNGIKMRQYRKGIKMGQYMETLDVYISKMGS